MLFIVKQIRKRLRPVKRIAWRLWCSWFVVPYARRNYRKRRGLKLDRPIRVLFLVNEITKWKMQSVLQAMISDTRFEPTIGLTIADIDWCQTSGEIESKHMAIKNYFSRYEVKCVQLCDIYTRKTFSPLICKPDVVFYQQPWDYAYNQHPAVVSRFADTCYVQYYVPDYGDAEFDCGSLFTRSLCRFYTLSGQWSAYYRDYMPDTAGEYVAVGHPMLDLLHFDLPQIDGDCVIYAPHWSITYPGFLNSEHYSTFMDNGLEMLEYARKHPEIKWAFKPHPNLRYALVKSGAWSNEKVAAYFRSWEDIAEVCYDSGYADLFRRSRLLITDCGSFLPEYAATGRPLIRLVSSTCSVEISSVSRRLFDSFYNVNNFCELVDTMERLLIRGLDPKREERRLAAAEFGLLANDAAGKILNDIAGLYD